MLDGSSVVEAFKACGVTHVVWIPDSVLGQWDDTLRTAGPDLQLIRVCREGEALAVAGGLLLGGRRPIVLIQCTGLFEAGDTLRNVVHDLGLPLFLVVGVRSLHAHRRGKSTDTCPVYTEPFLQAWRIPYTLLNDDASAEDLSRAYQSAHETGKAAAVLLPE
jgi:sulfopyruvate decarboxylase TPP-binding subunit